MKTSTLSASIEGVLSRSEMKSIIAGTTVCQIMPGSCACDFENDGDEDGFEQCLDDRYGPE